MGNGVCGLWERQRLFHRAVNAFSIGKAAVFHISMARILLLREEGIPVCRQQAVRRDRDVPRRHQQPPDKDAAADKASKDEVQKEQGDPAAQRAAARYDPEPQPPDPKWQPAEDPEPEIIQLPVLYAGGAEDAVQQRGRRHRQDGLAEKVF